MRKIFSHYTTMAVLLLVCSTAAGLYFLYDLQANSIRIPMYWLLVVSILNLIIALILIKNVLDNNHDLSFKFIGSIDSLTGLLSFNKFCSKLKSTLYIKNKSTHAIVYFDIDNFKVINDTYGYDFGDLVLCHVAKTLKEMLKNGELFSRFSNDFFVVCKEYTYKSEVIDTVQELIKRLKNSKINNTNGIEIPISCGIFFISNNNADINEMINKANIARSSTKQQNKAKYVVYNDEMRAKLTYELKIEQDLRVALDNNQLEVYYQPKFCLSTGKMSGMEALVRWKHPELGFISPSTFIPIAEKKGLIVEIGRFVFEEVCKSIYDWGESLPNHINVCVNLSRVELYQPDLMDFIRKIVQKYNVSPDRIDIELTETAAISDLDFINSVISQFKDEGFSIAMDDFGTGYSSLSCLKLIPIDVLKLDRSFMRNLNNDPSCANVVRAVIKLAKSLNFEVVAEGIETKEQADFLHSAGCDVGQGFYYAKPMPKNELEQVLVQAGQGLIITCKSDIEGEPVIYNDISGAAEFIKEYFVQYFKHKNFDYIVSSFTDDISWIGISAYEASIGFEQTYVAVKNEVSTPSVTFEINDINLSEQWVSEGTSIVTGNFVINAKINNLPSDYGVVRVTAVCITKNTEIKIGHLHFSRPSYELGGLDLSEHDPLYLKIMKYYTDEKMDRRFAELVMKLYKKNRLLSDLVSSDGLTCLYNHKHINERVKAYIKEYETNGTPFSILMMDLDNFKEINDENGHLIGDEVLVRVSGIIRRCIDSKGIAGRYGGDEFLILLPGKNLSEAHVCAEKIKTQIECEEFTELKIKVSCSIGVSEIKDGLDCKALIKNADDNLYKAKALGKRSVVS